MWGASLATPGLANRCRAGDKPVTRTPRKLLVVRSENLVQHTAVREVHLVRLLPAAEALLDREQLDVRELRLVSGRHPGAVNAVEALRQDLLTRLAVEELQIRRRDGPGAVTVGDLVYDGNREVRLHAQRRIHDFEPALRVLLTDGADL